MDNGYFRTQSLETEGFTHCAKPSQLEYVMNKYFKADSYVLFISASYLLGSEVKYEGRDESNLYPHLYRRFNKADALEVINIHRGSDGKFILPSVFIKPKMCLESGMSCRSAKCCPGLNCSGRENYLCE